jgi:hypothetical protein
VFGVEYYNAAKPRPQLVLDTRTEPQTLWAVTARLADTACNAEQSDAPAPAVVQQLAPSDSVAYSISPSGRPWRELNDCNKLNVFGIPGLFVVAVCRSSSARIDRYHHSRVRFFGAHCQRAAPCAVKYPAVM